MNTVTVTKPPFYNIADDEQAHLFGLPIRPAGPAAGPAHISRLSSIMLHIRPNSCICIKATQNSKR